MSTAPEPVVVIGIGNRWRRDDAIGLEVAGRLRARGVAARDAEGETVELLELWERAGSAIVIDAAGPGAQPGTVHRFEAADAPIPAGLSSTSTHALGIAEAVELARTLGRLPERLLVFAIEGADFSAGEGLSPRVAATVDPVVDMILRELQLS